MRIRSTWEGENWTGKFADEGEEWDDYKYLKDKLDYQFKQDGDFWMCWPDFTTNFNRVYLCKIFPAAWSQYSVHGEWLNNSSGGPYPVGIPAADANQEKKPIPEKVLVDTNDKWFNNPQYRISVTKKTTLIISLM